VGVRGRLALVSRLVRRRRPGSLAIALLAAWIGAVPLTAQDLPALTAPVNDLANVIDEATERELDRRLRTLQTTTGDAIIVATVPSIAPFATIEEYAVRLFERAGIGDRARDTGALLLVAVNDRQVRVEVGYGLEEFITDGYAGETIRRAILPAFRQGDYSAGVLAGATRLVQRVAEGRGVTLPDVPVEPEPAPVERGGPPIGLLIALVIILLMMGRLGRGRRRRRWSRSGPFVSGPWIGGGWHGGLGGFGRGFGGGFGGRRGGGGFGGFGGFGGGMSGGGGATGRW
jgi:uncharacterized protein